MSKYGKPIWRWVLDTARELESDKFSPIDIIRKIQDQNPKIPSSTIRSYVMAMAPNHPSSKHYPSTRKLHGYFNFLGDGIFELKTGISQPVDVDENEDIEYEDLTDTQLSLERDLESFISDDVSSIEDGLTLYNGANGRQYTVESGRIDLLTQDKEGGMVVIELKAGEAKDSTLAQILSYMDDIKTKQSNVDQIRGLVIAHEFSPRLVKAVSFLPNIELIKYRVKFDFVHLKP